MPTQEAAQAADDVRTHRTRTARHAGRHSGAVREPASVRPWRGGGDAGGCLSRRQAAACAALCRAARHRQGDARLPPRLSSAEVIPATKARRPSLPCPILQSSLFRQIAIGAHPSVLHLTRPVNDKTKGFKTVVTVDEIRRVNRFLSMTSHDGGYRVVIVDPADDMNTNAANALAEEPGGAAVAHGLHPDRRIRRAGCCRRSARAARWSGCRRSAPTI